MDSEQPLVHRGYRSEPVGTECISARSQPPLTGRRYLETVPEVATVVHALRTDRHDGGFNPRGHGSVHGAGGLAAHS